MKKAQDQDDKETHTNELEAFKEYHDKCRDLIHKQLEQFINYEQINTASNIWQQYAQQINWLKRQNQQLQAQLSSLIKELDSIKKITDFGANEQIKKKQLKQIIKDLSRRTKTDNMEARSTIMLDRLARLEKVVKDLLELSWELSEHKKTCDPRQIKAMDILPSVSLYKYSP